jgi:hypothetical protein
MTRGMEHLTDTPAKGRILSFSLVGTGGNCTALRAERWGYEYLLTARGEARAPEADEMAVLSIWRLSDGEEMDEDCYPSLSQAKRAAQSWRSGEPLFSHCE